MTNRRIRYAAPPAGVLVLLVLTTVALPARGQAERALDDRIEQVTLFSDQALLRRTARASLGAGRHRLAFDPLPEAVDASSVRVLIDGGRLLGFEIVRGYGEQELPPELQSKRDRIERIDRELAVLDGTKAVLTAEIAFLTNLPAGSPRPGEDGAPPRVDPSTMKKFIDWAAGRLETAGGELLALDLQRVELVEEREVLASELLGTEGAGAALSRSRVVALVEMDRSATATATLVYRTWSARWVPSYDIRLSTGEATMWLGFNALVWQQTEEDWTGVDLELSTAVPAQSAALPELLAWYIEETPPPPPPVPVMADDHREAERRGRRQAPRASRSVASAPAPMEEAAADYDYDYGYGYGEVLAAEEPAPPAAMGYGGGSAGAGRSSSRAPARQPTSHQQGLVDALRNEASARAYMQDRSWPLLDTSGRQAQAVGSITFDPFGGRLQVAPPSVSTEYESSTATWGSYAPSSNAMGFAFSFEVEAPVTVPSDGLVHKVPLLSLQFPARIEHVIVPVVEEAAFVQAVVDNGSPYPMLAGMSNVFLDGGYLGRVPTHTVAPGQPLELALGIDRSVKVSREQEQLSDRGGLFGNQKVRAYRISVELENYRERAIDVRVLDRVAYSYDDEIKITLDERSHEPAEDLGTGMLEWHLTVDPGQKGELTFGYTLKHNRNYRVWHP